MGLIEIIGGVIAIAITAFFGGRFLGSMNEKKKQEVKDLKGANETTSKLSKVRPAPSADAARERLRNRGK